MAAAAGPIVVPNNMSQLEQTAMARAQRSSMHSVMRPSPLQNPPVTYQTSEPSAKDAGSARMSGSHHRRMSSGSHTSVATSYMSGRESFDSRRRSTSFGSQASLDSRQSSAFTSPYASPYASPRSPSYPAAQLQGGYSPWARPHGLKQYRRRAKPGEIFAELPGEVLGLILAHLKQLHLAPESTSCATCWMRDCCSVALSARKWLKFARVALYEDIQLNGQDSPHMKKRLKGIGHARLVLLRRTLRANAHLATLVHSLKVPSMIPAGCSLEEYHNLVASLIMACPDFERLAGFYPGYDHSFSRLFHALSTRTKLKEMNWVVESSPFQRQHRIQASGSHFLTPGDLQPFQSATFLELHTNWQNITSMSLHCLPGGNLTPDSMLERAFRSLPRLRNLYLSHLPQTAFNDRSLLALPALHQLTLANLPGVTTAGLSLFATAKGSASLRSLSLLQINVDLLPALARIWSNLRYLESFSLVQSYPPVMPSDELIWLFPYLASSSMTKLHWDLPYLPTRASAADDILAKSIAAGGFPSLRSLRAPNDPDGIFQSLCRPLERADKPSDRYRGNTVQGHGRNASGFSYTHSYSGSVGSIATPASKSPTSPSFAPDAMMLPRDHSDLRQSRLAAQARLEAAKRFPRYFVNVTNEDGTLVEKFGIGAYIGSVESKIHYSLRPDPGATDESGGLAGINEMLGDCGEDLVLRTKEKEKEKESKKESKKDKETNDTQTREGCVGRWNAQSFASEKKDKDRWMHTERGRWRGISLF